MMSPPELKRRVRRASLEMLSNSLSLFHHAGIGEAAALPHIVDIAQKELLQSRQNYRRETVSHWRTYHKFCILCAVFTLMHVATLQRLHNLESVNHA